MARFQRQKLRELRIKFLLIQNLFFCLFCYILLFSYGLTPAKLQIFFHSTQNLIVICCKFAAQKLKAMITIQGKQFRKYILQSEIQQIVGNLAQRINKDYKNRGDIVFIVILNGAFMFASDLFKNIEGLHKITFVKLTSYESVNSTGKVKSLIGLKEDITNKNVIIVEDIVDSGKTMGDLLQQLQEKNPRSLEICSLMFKPGNFKGNYNIKYIGKEISNEFIVGYGFDLDGLGRNLPDIYQLSE